MGQHAENCSANTSSFPGGVAQVHPQHTALLFQSPAGWLPSVSALKAFGGATSSLKQNKPKIPPNFVQYTYTPLV